MTEPGPLTLGTAGHIDHGKTALIAALTGVNTDRLAEEQARGISIVLGYAPLALPSGRLLSVVDVPGHERFVRTMVAGATGIDLFLMVIAADDGVMPQTLEHAAVLRALAVHSGVVALTKSDLADPEPAMEQARELFPGYELAACSTRTGAGVSDVIEAIDRVAAKCPSRAASPGGTVLHIDRAFSLRGQGTVITGTLWSGSISERDTLALLPADRRVRVRSVEVHDRAVERAAAGQRVAVNLTGVRIDEVHRGDVLAIPGLLRETRTLDCSLELRGAEHNGRVQVHHGTRVAPGRLAALDEDLWQVRLEHPVYAADGDRLVIRRPSPPDTLGGGLVLDARARRHGPRPEIIARLRRLRDGEGDPVPTAPEPASPREATRGTSANSPPPVPAAELAAVEQRLRDAGQRPLTPAQLEARPEVLRALRDAGTVVRVRGELYAHAEAVEEARRRVVALIDRDGAVTLAGLRDDLGVSRKSAQALLEHFDSVHLTRRLPDDRRILSRRGAQAHAR